MKPYIGINLAAMSAIDAVVLANSIKRLPVEAGTAYVTGRHPDDSVVPMIVVPLFNNDDCSNVELLETLTEAGVKWIELIHKEESDRIEWYYGPDILHVDKSSDDDDEDEGSYW